MKQLVRFSVLLVCLFVASMASAMGFCPTTPPVIDGVFACREWDSAQTVDFEVNVPEGGTASARLYFMNDDKFLYIGVRILRTKLDDSVGFSAILDSNYDRIVSVPDDIMGVSYSTSTGSEAFDGVHFVGGICPIGALCTNPDTNFGGRNDVVARVGFDGRYETIEMAKPLAAQDAYDADMAIGSLVGTNFSMRLWKNGLYADTYYPDVPSVGKWVDYTVRDCRYW